MIDLENSFVARKAREVEEKQRLAQERKAQVWKDIQTEHQDLAAFMTGANAEFGKPADSEVVLNGVTVIEGKYHAKSAKAIEVLPKGEGEKVCRQCSHWAADKIGDGTGIGDCAKGNTRLCWPLQAACKLFSTTKRGN